MEKQFFYQSKYDYYREFNRWVVVVASLVSVTYFVSDCQLFGRFAWETLLPRTFILLPMLIFLLVSRKVTDYRIMVPFTYLIVHGIMWCTIWAIYYLPIRQHANEGFIIMHLMFFAVGFCAPFGYSTLFHVLVVANILISNLFNHYESLNLMLTLGIPCVVGICAVNYVMEKVYADQYKTKLELEKALTMDQLTKAFNRNKGALAYCVFATNHLNPSVLSHYRQFRLGEDYVKDWDSEPVKNMKIIPLETKLIVELLRDSWTYQKVYSVFENYYSSAETDARKWYKSLARDIAPTLA